MAETKVKVQLERDGWKLRARAFSASITFSTEFEPSEESHGLGLYRSKRSAKRAVETEVTKRSAGETRDGWWGGDVEEGRIEDESFSDPGYGWVESWAFVRDERTETAWMHAGRGWN